MEMNCKKNKKTNKTEFRTEKVTRKKVIHCMLSGKIMIICLTATYTKNIYYVPIIQNQIVVQKYKIKVELELSNYATKSGLNGETDIDTSKFAKNADLASIKSNVKKLDIEKLKNVPTDLSRLSNEVDNVKNTAYDEFVTKVNVIDTSE